MFQAQNENKQITKGIQPNEGPKNHSKIISCEKIDKIIPEDY
jgi:hypothetical protein